MILFYSGRDGNSEPENILGGRGMKADIMLTYVLSVKKTGKPTVRFANVHRQRKKEMKRLCVNPSSLFQEHVWQGGKCLACGLIKKGMKRGLNNRAER
jgi:hypothetical protein